MDHNRVAVVGHAGIGHAHGYAGFIQDDAGGFVTRRRDAAPHPQRRHTHQAALANSVIHTFNRQAPDRFTAVQESIGANRGLIGGLSVERDRVSLSYLASVNYTAGGLGPAEDLEGNVALGSKGDIMYEGLE